MATLTKANNSTSLTSAAAWTPAQVPTAADTLVFDATLGANLNLSVGSGTLYADRLTVGNVSGALTIGPSLDTPVAADALDMTDATANFTLRASMSSPDGGMGVVAKPARTLFMAPANSDMDVTFPLTAGTPIVTLNAAPSAEGVANYQAFTNSTVTVGATEDAYIAAAGYMAASNQSQLTKIVIPGHPTLPTSVTLKATNIGTFSVLSGAGLASSTNSCRAIEIGNDGTIYFGGTWSSVGSGSAQYNRLFGYDPVTQTVIPIWMGLTGDCYCLRKDSAGNIYIGVAGTLTGNLTSSGIVRYDPSTGLTTSLASGYPLSGYALDVCPASTGLVYIGGVASVAANRTAVWNPTTNTWSDLGTGCDNSVYAVAEDGTGRIWAGGQFTTAGGVAASRLAIWDPATSTWSAATAGATDATFVWSLQYDAVNNRMYVGYSGTTFAGIASQGVIYYDFGTASWVAMACPTSVGRQIRWVAATGRLYLVDGSQSTPIRYWDSATNTWNVLANQTGGTLFSLAIDSAGTVWAGTLSTAFTAPVATNGFIQCSSAGVISSVPFATRQVTTASSTSTSAFTFRGYAGTNFGLTPILNHAGGTATYTMAPGSDLCLQLLGGGLTAAANGAVVQVRRGGSLLERPTLTAQRGVSFRQPNDASLRLSGPVVSLSSTSATGVYSIYSDAERLDLNTAVTSTFKYVNLNFKGSELVLGAQGNNFTYVSGNFGSANVTVGLNPGANNPNEVFLGYTTTAVPRSLQGEPRELGPVTLGARIGVESRYFRANNTYVQVPVNAGHRVSFGSLTGYTNIVEWTSPSDVILSGFQGLVRVSSFAPFTALGTATHVYSGVAPVTVSVPPVANLSLATTSGAGALTYNAALLALSGSLPFNFIMLNTADNKLDADLSSLRGTSVNTVRASGTGTLRVVRDVNAAFEILAGNIIFDYSGASASAENMISSVKSLALTNFGGTATFLGKPGVATSQYLSGAFLQSIGTATSGDTTIILNPNGAPSLSLNVAGISTTQPSNPASALYIQGLSASASLAVRTGTSGANGMLSWALLTDGLGDANWLATTTVNNNISSAAYTGALPTSGGVGTENLFLNGAQTQLGNTTGYALKITPSAAGQALDHTGYALTITRQFVLCGTAGGVYTIQGTPGSAFQFTPRFIANVSNTELRLVTQLVPGSSVATSGTGVVSFGSPATTYVGVDTATRYLNAVETRIYAGTDNLAPVLTSGAVYVGGNAAVRLSGAGTGRTLASFLRMQQFSRLIVDDDWTIAGLEATSTGSSVFAEIYIDVAATKTLQMQCWNNTVTTPTSVTYATGTVFVKRGAGAFRLLGIPLNTSIGPAMRVEEGSLEIAMDGTYGPWGITPTCMLLELLAGRPLTLNSSVDHDFSWVIFGAGSVSKQNTNTVYVRSRNSFTGGLTISAGEFDAAYRYACGDGNVTVSGGILRASAVEEDPYALEIAGNLVFSGGSLALGADYVV